MQKSKKIFPKTQNKLFESNPVFLIIVFDISNDFYPSNSSWKSEKKYIFVLKLTKGYVRGKHTWAIAKELVKGDESVINYMMDVCCGRLALLSGWELVLCVGGTRVSFNILLALSGVVTHIVRKIVGVSGRQHRHTHRSEPLSLGNVDTATKWSEALWLVTGGDEVATTPDKRKQRWHKQTGQNDVCGGRGRKDREAPRARSAHWQPTDWSVLRAARRQPAALGRGCTRAHRPIGAWPAAVDQSAAEAPAHRRALFLSPCHFF